MLKTVHPFLTAGDLRWPVTTCCPRTAEKESVWAEHCPLPGGVASSRIGVEGSASVH